MAIKKIVLQLLIFSFLITHKTEASLHPHHGRKSYEQTERRRSSGYIPGEIDTERLQNLHTTMISALTNYTSYVQELFEQYKQAVDALTNQLEEKRYSPKGADGFFIPE